MNSFKLETAQIKVSRALAETFAELYNEKTRCNRQRVRSTCDTENIQTASRLSLSADGRGT